MWDIYIYIHTFLFLRIPLSFSFFSCNWHSLFRNGGRGTTGRRRDVGSGAAAAGGGAAAAVRSHTCDAQPRRALHPVQYLRQRVRGHLQIQTPNPANRERRIRHRLVTGNPRLFLPVLRSSCDEFIFYFVFVFFFFVFLGSSAVNSETSEHVAVKKIANAFDNKIDAKRTLREIKLLRHMDHENVGAFISFFLLFFVLLLYEFICFRLSEYVGL